MDIFHNEVGIQPKNPDNTNQLLDTNVYYGVHVPNSLECQLFEDVEKTNVFTDKMEALKLVKKYKKARFKVFSYYHEAIEFATHGSEFPNNNLSFGMSGLKEETDKEVSPVIANEKCQFRGPKSQDLVKLRKAIESNDLNYVERTVWENPRYLISSGDTPSILQEGFRYNGLHVAAKAKNAEMCELILNTIGNVSFIKKLYGEDSNQDSSDRLKILLDLYLNMPDKGLNETPLHFAVKFGAFKVTEVLVSFPQCDKGVRNKYGKLPCQIICDRCDGQMTENLKQQIANLLEDNYYVPVLRYEDNCGPPVVGEPFLPSSPPDLSNNPIKPRLEIHAYAGPMDKKGADKFRKIWKTPPRSVSKSTLPHKREVLSSSLDSVSKLCDPEKGLETVGRELANKYNVTWHEYWPFLDNFVDICSDEGLTQFEAYLRDRTERSLPSPSCKPESPNFIDSLCKKFDALCNLDDEDSMMIVSETLENEDVCPFVCVEHSLKIFAKRICNILRNIMRSTETMEFHNNNSLISEMKLFEQLIMSYSTDRRFSEINFQCAHPRLADLIVLHLRLIENNTISLLSMQDPVFSTNKHLECILRNILKRVNEEPKDSHGKECQVVWENMEICSCAFNNKQNKQKYGSRKRNNGVKLRGGVKSNFNGISRNLFKSNDLSDMSSSEDEFYTPPTSPSLIGKDFFAEDDDDDEESYNDSRLPNADIFIEGSEPTKIDRDVYNALKYASPKLNPKDFPNIYKWRHTVTLYTDDERKSWSSTKPECFLPNLSKELTSTPCRGNSISAKDHNGSFSSPPVHASPKSWFRVTGLNSPRASLNTYKNNLSFNM